MVKLLINDEKKLGTIAPEIYGQFSEHLGRCIYEGLYVGEDSDIPNVNGMRSDVVEALKEIHVPLLRWPGGCFADEYHWKNGIGEKTKREKKINTNWGGVIEDNSFGTHEFFELCRQLGCKTYINGNVGTGSAQEMADWIEYMTFDGVSAMADLRRKNGREEPWNVDYFGIGNENWGCGGNMLPEYYGNLYRHYQTFLHQYQPDKPFKRICCGPNAGDYDWTRRILKTCFESTPADAHGRMELLSLHYYTVPGTWENKGKATEFDENDWYETLNKTLEMEKLISGHGAIMDQYDPDKKIGMSIDEWGTWYQVEPGTNPGFLYQQNTMRDAVLAGLNFDIFNHHCDRVRLACIAQMVNVLQSMILTDGSRMVKTPTYHAFHMYRHHQGAELLETSLMGVKEIGPEEWKVPELSQTVSMKDNVMTITMTNPSATGSLSAEAVFCSGRAYRVTEARVLNGDRLQAHNSFEDPERVSEGDFISYRMKEHSIEVVLPAHSILEIRLEQA